MVSRCQHKQSRPVGKSSVSGEVYRCLSCGEYWDLIPSNNFGDNHRREFGNEEFGIYHLLTSGAKVDTEKLQRAISHGIERDLAKRDNQQLLEQEMEKVDERHSKEGEFPLEPLELNLHDPEDLMAVPFNT